MKPETLRRYFGDMPPLNDDPNRDTECLFRGEHSEAIQSLMTQERFLKNLWKQACQSRVITFNSNERRGRVIVIKWPDFFSRCQKSSSKFFSHSTPPSSKTQSPLYERGTVGIYDSRQSPNPLLTAERSFDSSEREGRDEPW